MAGGTMATLEGRHHAMGGNSLRAAVLGANDGLVSNFSLVMGVTGAATDQRVVLLTGLAGFSPAPAPWRWRMAFSQQRSRTLRASGGERGRRTEAGARRGA